MNDDSLVDRLRKYDRLVLSIQMRIEEAVYAHSEEDLLAYQRAVHDEKVLLANCGFALLFQDTKEQQYH